MTTMSLRIYVFIFHFSVYLKIGSLLVAIVYKNLHEVLRPQSLASSNSFKNNRQVYKRQS